MLRLHAGAPAFLDKLVRLLALSESPTDAELWARVERDLVAGRLHLEHHVRAPELVQVRLAYFNVQNLLAWRLDTRRGKQIQQTIANNNVGRSDAKSLVVETRIAFTEIFETRVLNKTNQIRQIGETIYILVLSHTPAGHRDTFWPDATQSVARSRLQGNLLYFPREPSIVARRDTHDQRPRTPS